MKMGGGVKLSKDFKTVKKFCLLSFTLFLLSSATFYQVLPRLVLSFTQYPTFGARG